MLLLGLWLYIRITDDDWKLYIIIRKWWNINENDVILSHHQMSAYITLLPYSYLAMYMCDYNNNISDIATYVC